MTRTTHKAVKVFCSYSHRDEEHLDELKTWLTGLRRQGLIEEWHDRKIVPGQEWEEAIDENLKTAEIVLLLVTPTFMSSEYAYEKEMSRAVDRHRRGEARVIPVIVRPTDWEWAPFSKLQALPKDAKPITRWPDRDEAWLDVVKGIRKAVELLLERQERAAKEEYRKAVVEAWTHRKLSKAEAEQLSALADELGLSTNTAADIEHEVMGDTKEALLERQDRLEELYAQAQQLHQDQKWQEVADVFDQIHELDQTYPDPEGLLESARKAQQEEEERQNRLEELYTQACRSHQAQEWQAVVDTFDQIHQLDPAYPDPEGLLASARQELAAREELMRRVAAAYDQGQRHMEAEEWEQALERFEEVQRLEPGYRDTETLLRECRWLRLGLREENRRFVECSEIVGLAIGDRETSLALADVSSTTEPEILEINGRRNFITAVAEHPERGVIVGEDAYKARDLDSRWEGFKSPDLDNPDVREPVKMFVGEILDHLLENRLIQGNGRSCFVVGCPSGWDAITRWKWAALMREAGLQPVTVISEGIAAVIHAKEANLGVSDEQLSGSVLIIDIGASGTDFTTVVNLSEKYEDFGRAPLGTGLLDKAILARTLASYEPQERARLREIFSTQPSWKAKAELICRKAKETYFSDISESGGVAEASIRLHTKPSMHFDVELTRQDMEEILPEPMAVLYGRSWPDAFREELIHTKERIKFALPNLVLLIGEGAKMDFVLTLCKEVFSDALLLRLPDSSFGIIAKGLAQAGRAKASGSWK